MVILILCFCLLTFLVAVGAAKLQPWDSSRDMINAAWLDHPSKFELIARWGIMG